MARTVSAIDVASYQPRDLSGIIQEHKPAHVVVRMYLPGERPPQQHSIDQVESARANGCPVGAYLWAYREWDPRQTVRDAVALARQCGLGPPVLWIDCETYAGDPGPDAAWLREAVAECAALKVRPGIYTGGWWWRDRMGNTAEFAEMPLWAAQYDGAPDLASVQLFGGWTAASGKQWTDKAPDGSGLDRDVFLEEVVGLTIEQLRRVNPHLRQQLTEWQRARRTNGEDIYEYPAFRQHLIDIGAPDPGPVGFAGF